MKPTDFIEKYYLHDSLLKGFDVSADGSTVTLTIDLCNWQQDWYKKTMPETQIVKVIFSGVSKITGGIDVVNGNGILKCKALSNKEKTGFQLYVIQDYLGGNGEVDELQIWADGVTVEPSLA